MTRGFVALLHTTGSADIESIIPNNWQTTMEDDGWVSVIRDNNSDIFFHLRLILDGNDFEAPGRGVYIAVGERTILKPVWNWCKNNSISVWTISQLRGDDSTVAKRIKNAWKDERNDQSGSVVSLYRTIAGFRYAEGLELTLSGSDIENA